MFKKILIILFYFPCSVVMNCVDGMLPTYFNEEDVISRMVPNITKQIWRINDRLPDPVLNNVTHWLFHRVRHQYQGKDMYILWKCFPFFSGTQFHTDSAAEDPAKRILIPLQSSALPFSHTLIERNSRIEQCDNSQLGSGTLFDLGTRHSSPKRKTQHSKRCILIITWYRTQ